MVCRLTTSDTGDAYSTKSIGPRTDPCGTPKERTDGLEEAPFTQTVDAIKEMGLKPTQNSTTDAKRSLKSGRKDRMINSVKGSGQVQESKKGNIVIIKAKKNVINYPQESCFSAV